MAVHVVAVGGVDVVAQPGAGVGDRQLGVAEPGVDRGSRLLRRGAALLEAEGGAAVAHRHLFEQRLGEAVIVVAGDEEDLAPRHRLAQLLEEGTRRGQHLGQRQFAQLEGVAEQDEAVGGADLLEQRRPDRRVAQEVLAEGAAEVQVGDDRGAHVPKPTLGCPASPTARLRWVSAVLSDERLARANGVELAYQEAGDPDGEPLILIMGLAAQMLAWQEDFCAMLADRGFRVVRFDNRDIGHSTILREAGMPSRLDMFTGRRATAPYLLADMARDTFGLMDELGIESAHVTGASMGGMIGQTMAILQPERVRSLVSLMSTTGNRRVGSPTFRAWGLLLSKFPHGRDDYVKRALKTFRVIGSPDHRDEREIEELAGAMYDRGHDTAAIIRQMHAISASGDRTEGLERIQVPTTVLHGARDPLARPAAGRATAEAIPGAHLRIFEGMGHDLPRALWPDFVDEIAAAAERGGATLRAAPAEAA